MKAVALALATVALLIGTFALTRTSDADDKVDCHGLKKWDKSATYKDGDIVWAENSDWHSDGAKYQCKTRGVTCTKAYEPKGMSDWKSLGNCKAGTKP